MYKKTNNSFHTLKQDFHYRNTAALNYLMQVRLQWHKKNFCFYLFLYFFISIKKCQVCDIYKLYCIGYFQLIVIVTIFLFWNCCSWEKKTKAAKLNQLKKWNTTRWQFLYFKSHYQMRREKKQMEENELKITEDWRDKTNWPDYKQAENSPK